MSELWSPQMRKWARDAERHGIDIGLIKHRPNRYSEAGAGLPNLVRMTDNGGVRIIDQPHNPINNADRRIDRVPLQ